MCNAPFKGDPVEICWWCCTALACTAPPGKVLLIAGTFSCRWTGKNAMSLCLLITKYAVSKSRLQRPLGVSRHKSELYSLVLVLLDTSRCPLATQMPAWVWPSLARVSSSYCVAGVIIGSRLFSRVYSCSRLLYILARCQRLCKAMCWMCSGHIVYWWIAGSLLFGHCLFGLSRCRYVRLALSSHLAVTAQNKPVL